MFAKKYLAISVETGEWRLILVEFCDRITHYKPKDALLFLR